MNYHVWITQSAERDMRQNHQWWAENRSAEQAARWLVGIDEIIQRLSENADKNAFATENELRKLGVKQVSFGLGRRPSHRILYRIENDQVVIYRVRAFKQDAIGPDDL